MAEPNVMHDGVKITEQDIKALNKSAEMMDGLGREKLAFLTGCFHGVKMQLIKPTK